jgi:hypothetical protein
MNHPIPERFAHLNLNPDLYSAVHDAFLATVDEDGVTIRVSPDRELLRDALRRIREHRARS